MTLEAGLITNGSERTLGYRLPHIDTKAAATVDLEARTVSVIVSDGSIDRDGDTVDPNGWQLEKYIANPVVFFGHKSREMPIGKSLEIGVQGGQLVARAQFVTQDANPLGMMVLHSIQQGSLRGVSAGFRVLKSEDRIDADTGRWTGLNITSQELWEWSVVPIPSNPNAMAKAAAEGVDIDPWLQFVERELDHGDKGLELPYMIAKGRAIQLNHVRAILPESVADEETHDTVEAILKDADAALERLINPPPPEEPFISTHKAFPKAEAVALKSTCPQVWKMGTAPEFDPETADREQMEEREALASAAIHKDTSEGVVDCVRLGVVHSLGIDHMRATLAKERQRVAQGAADDFWREVEDQRAKDEQSAWGLFAEEIQE